MLFLIYKCWSCLSKGNGPAHRWCHKNVSPTEAQTNMAVDLHHSKPLISLVPFNMHLHCFQVMSQSLLFSQPITNILSNRCRLPQAWAIYIGLQERCMKTHSLWSVLLVLLACLGAFQFQNSRTIQENIM